MRAKETDVGSERDERRSGLRFVIILTASILLLFALTVGALYLLFKSQQRERRLPPPPAANHAGVIGKAPPGDARAHPLHLALAVDEA